MFYRGDEMAQKGYWIICEDLYAGNKMTREPSMCMGYVYGFHYAEAMGRSRMEVLAIIRRKLKENIRFITDCYNDLPLPSDSDNPPQGQNKPHTAYLFLSLQDIDPSLTMMAFQYR